MRQTKSRKYQKGGNIIVDKDAKVARYNDPNLNNKTTIELHYNMIQQ